jgi:hypothetical protein
MYFEFLEKGKFLIKKPRTSETLNRHVFPKLAIPKRSWKSQMTTLGAVESLSSSESYAFREMLLQIDFLLLKCFKTLEE